MELQTRMQLSHQLTLLSLRASKMKFRSQTLRGVSLVLFMVQIISYSSNKYAPPSTRPTTWKMASLFQIRSKHISTSFEMLLFIFRLPWHSLWFVFLADQVWRSCSSLNTVLKVSPP